MAGDGGGDTSERPRVGVRWGDYTAAHGGRFPPCRDQMAAAKAGLLFSNTQSQPHQRPLPGETAAVCGSAVCAAVCAVELDVLLLETIWFGPDNMHAQWRQV